MAISMNEFWIKSMEESMDMFMNEYLIKSVDSSIDEQIPLCISLGATCNSALYLRGL